MLWMAWTHIEIRLSSDVSLPSFPNVSYAAVLRKWERGTRQHIIRSEDILLEFIKMKLQINMHNVPTRCRFKIQVLPPKTKRIEPIFGDGRDLYRLSSLPTPSTMVHLLWSCLYETLHVSVLLRLGFPGTWLKILVSFIGPDLPGHHC